MFLPQNRDAAPAAPTTDDGHLNKTTVIVGLVLAILLFTGTSAGLIWYLLRIRRQDHRTIPSSEHGLTFWTRNLEPVEDIRSPHYKPKLIQSRFLTEFRRPESAHCRSPVSPLTPIHEKLEHRWWSSPQQLGYHRTLSIEEERSKAVVVQL